jgi:hypothetical protein
MASEAMTLRWKIVVLGALAIGEHDAWGAAAPRFTLRYSAPASCPERS